METAPPPDDALLGYSDRLSAVPGEPIRFFVSSPAPEYDVSLVRLIHGDPNPDGPGFKEELVTSAIDGRHPVACSRCTTGRTCSCRTRPSSAPLAPSASPSGSVRRPRGSASRGS